MKEFHLYGETIIFSDGQENYNRLRLEAEANAGRLKQEFMERYQASYRNMEQVVNGVFDLGEEYLRRAASWCVEQLGKHHIYNYDTDRFLKSCTVSLEEWLGACDAVLDAYSSVLANAGLRDSVKQWQNNYHIKWLGEASSPERVLSVSWMTGKPVSVSAAELQQYTNLVTLFNSGAVQETLGEGLRAAAADMHQGVSLLLQGQADFPVEGLDPARLGDFSAVFANLNGGIAADEEILPQAAELIRLFPYSRELYFFLFDHYGDPSGVLSEMAEYLGLGPCITEYKLRFVEDKIASFDFTDGESLPSVREQVRELCEKSGVSPASYLSAIDGLIKTADEYARNVDGFPYEDAADAQNAKSQLQELFARTRGLTGNQEEEIQAIIGWLETCSCNTKEKYLAYLRDALNRTEIRFRTVKSVLFDSREEASEARTACGHMEELLAAPRTSIAAIRSLLETARALPSKISVIYTELLDAMLDVWNRQDILYSTKALCRPETRAAYTALWYEALGLYQEGELLALGNEAYNRWFSVLRTDFLTVKGVLHENAKEANRSYFKILSHAAAYKKYIEEKNNSKKGFFSSLKNSVSGLWTENYQEDFAWITANGTRFLPADTKEDGAALDAQYASAVAALDNRARTLRQLLDRAQVPHALQDEALSLEPLMLPEKHLTPEEVIAALNPVLKYHPLDTAGFQTTSRRIRENICPSCGATLAEDALFCTRCGAKRS